MNDKFNQFQVDGVPVENLGILDETRNIVSFKTYLDNANANYTVFKQNWHDTQEGAVIRVDVMGQKAESTCHRR